MIKPAYWIWVKPLTEAPQIITRKGRRYEMAVSLPVYDPRTDPGYRT